MRNGTRPVLRLTIWYVMILAAIVLTFSLVTFGLSINEFERAARELTVPICVVEPCPDMQIYLLLRQQLIEDGPQRFMTNLFMFDASIIVLGAIASYLLAKQTLKPIEDSLLAQARFSSDVSNELRTPLAIMQSEIEVELRNKQASARSYRQLLESNLEEVERMRQLTNRLLSLSSNKKLVMKSVDLESVAITAVNRMMTPAIDKQVAIENNVHSHLVYGNEDSLVDVLTILIDNAIKYSPSGSQIDLISKKVGKKVQVSVIDQGVGISLDHQTKIFERFYRLDKSRSKVGNEGFGLGLALAKRIIELHKGRVWVISQPGHGSTFTVEF